MTTAAPIDPDQLLEALGASFLRVHALIGNAEEAQWKAGATPRPVDDTTERSKGTTSDPVVHALLDGRRLNLREAVAAAERALQDTLATLTEVADRLEAAPRINSEDSVS